MNKLDEFRFYCQKVLPLVYDNSLSYYEVLCKIQKTLNDLIKNNNELQDAFNNLLQWIDAEIDRYIQLEIEKKIEDGTLGNIINQTLLKEINDKVDTNTQDITTLNKNLTQAQATLNKKINDVQTDLTKKINDLQNLVDESFANLDLLNKVPKSKPLFKTRAWVGSLTQVKVPQSICYSKERNKIYIAYADESATVTTGVICVYDGTNFNRLTTSGPINFNHANGITYCSNDDKLYVCSYDGAKVYVVNPDTFDIFKTYNLAPQGVDRTVGIAYNSVDNVFYLYYYDLPTDANDIIATFSYDMVKINQKQLPMPIENSYCQDIEYENGIITVCYQSGLRYLSTEFNVIKDIPISGAPRTEPNGICSLGNDNYATVYLGFKGVSDNVHGTTYRTDVMAARLLVFNLFKYDDVANMISPFGSPDSALYYEEVTYSGYCYKDTNGDWVLQNSYSSPRYTLPNNDVKIVIASAYYAVMENTVDYWATVSRGLSPFVINESVVQAAKATSALGAEKYVFACSYVASKGLNFRCFNRETGKSVKMADIPSDGYVGFNFTFTLAIRRI